MSKVLLFDLYNTLLIDEKFSFVDGLRYLYEVYFKAACTWEELSSYSAELWNLYDDRRRQNRELMFIRDEVPLFFKKFGVKQEIPDPELDYQLLAAMEQERILPETAHTLKKLYESGAQMYILSNSIYLASSNQRMVESFGIMKYFRSLFSSAEIGWRKPDRRFFDAALAEIQKDNPGVERKDMIFVGNDYETDVRGGIEAGLQTVWYNWEPDAADGCRRDTKGYGVPQIRAFSELLGEKGGSYEG